MPTKKPIKKIFEDTPIESADIKRELPESAQADATGDEPSAEANPQEEMIEPSTETSLFSEEADAEKTDIGDTGAERTDAEETEAVADDPQNEEPSAEEVLDAQDTDDETSTDDLLDDVRRSLIEAESDKEQKESSWWRRIGRKTKKVKPEETQTPVEIDLPPMPISAEPAVEQPSAETEEIDQIDDLIDLLKAKSDQAAVESVAPEVEAPSEPEPEIDFEELKKQAFSPRAEGEESESITDVRSIALEGGEEVLVEVEAKKPDTVQERISAFENALKPYRQYIYIALAILGVGMAAFASLIIYNVYQRSRPEPVKTVSNLPYPTGVSLPGGWSFQLGRGALENGEWNPRGPEWLEGTEVCRWVALPWSRQLEAVIRTLNPKDPIDLVMSNNDKFVYQVYSVKQLSPEELQQQRDSNTPCLLLILTQPDVEKRWVLTALP